MYLRKYHVTYGYMPESGGVTIYRAVFMSVTEQGAINSGLYNLRQRSLTRAEVNSGFSFARSDADGCLAFEQDNESLLENADVVRVGDSILGISVPRGSMSDEDKFAHVLSCFDSFLELDIPIEWIHDVMADRGMKMQGEGVTSKIKS